jgi:hypothetical protein
MSPDNANPTLQVQLVDVVLPAGELEFAGHARQVSTDVAPVVVEYVPAPQLLHAAEPLASLYVPVAHAEHVSPSGPVKPTLHVQSATAELELGELEPAGHVTQVVAIVAAVVVEYVPAPQSAHAALPVTTLYLPVTQAVHVPPSGPV